MGSYKYGKTGNNIWKNMVSGGHRDDEKINISDILGKKPKIADIELKYEELLMYSYKGIIQSAYFPLYRKY